MWTAAVVEGQIAADPGTGFRDAGIGPQVDLLVFDGPPQALDEDVVPPGALAVHADLDLAAGQHLDEVGGDRRRCAGRSMIVAVMASRTASAP